MQTFRPDSDKDYIAQLEDRLADQIESTGSAWRMCHNETSYLRKRLSGEQKRFEEADRDRSALALWAAIMTTAFLLLMTI